MFYLKQNCTFLKSCFDFVNGFFSEFIDANSKLITIPVRYIYRCLLNMVNNGACVCRFFCSVSIEMY